MFELFNIHSSINLFLNFEDHGADDDLKLLNVIESFSQKSKTRQSVSLSTTPVGPMNNSNSLNRKPLRPIDTTVSSNSSDFSAKSSLAAVVNDKSVVGLSSPGQDQGAAAASASEKSINKYLKKLMDDKM